MKIRLFQPCTHQFATWWAYAGEWSNYWKQIQIWKKQKKNRTENVYSIRLSKVSNQGDKRSQTKKAGICKDVCREISKTNYVIYLTIIIRFDFTFSKTISPMFYMGKQTEWLLFVLPIWDIKQINMICCKVINMLEMCDIDNIYKQNVNTVLYRKKNLITRIFIRVLLSVDGK